MKLVLVKKINQTFMLRKFVKRKTLLTSIKNKTHSHVSIHKQYIFWKYKRTIDLISILKLLCEHRRQSMNLYYYPKFQLI